MTWPRYRDWKIWIRGNQSGRLYQILVLFGLVDSPTFEVFRKRRAL